MSLNKLSDNVVQQVVTLLASVSTQKYKHTRPESPAPEQFIVINAFCVGSGPLQKFVLNVNCHARNLSGGVIDNLKLSTMSQSVLNILEDYNSTALLIDFEGQEIIPETQLNEHYSNLKFSLKTINT